MTTTKAIYTLNARDHVMIEAMRDYFNLGSKEMFREIQGVRNSVEDALRKKGINYKELRSALVPAQNKREIALVFDTTAIDSTWYGFEVMKRIIPFFHRQSNHSVLLGDYLDRPGHEEQLVAAFRQAVELRREVNFQHPTQFFIVYINNLTDSMVQCFDKGLLQYCGYAGIADTTYSSLFKACLSTMLANFFVKNGKIILQGHEPDRAAEDDVNMSGYPFEENGYVCRSISSDLMGVLLSYKIERPVYPGFEEDTEFALNAIGSTSMNIYAFEIEVEEEKIKHLKKEKHGSFKRAELLDITKEQLADLIRAKIQENYIYNLCFNEKHNVMKFNIILEFPSSPNSSTTRLLASLEYQAERRKLRLITLY